MIILLLKQLKFLKEEGRKDFAFKQIKSQNKNYAISRFEKNREPGFIDKAINLITFDDVYSDVFKYVFGDTLVFSDLVSARFLNKKLDKLL